MSYKSSIDDNSYKPIVFLNTPIESDETDVIGIDSSVLSAKAAINNGANMIGVIADYGTGKSSITQYLVNNEPDYHSININMWDCLNQKDAGQSIENISNLSKSFLYQLAVNSTDKRGSSTFAKHINKRLSKNYGLISFSVISVLQWLYFLLAGLFYSFYQALSNSKSYLTFPNWLIATSPLFLFIAILFLVFGIRKSSIAFSHWKDQSGKNKDVNDLFEVYDQIASRLYKSRPKSQKHIIIVEDLDRISDKSMVIGFLKELYRFQNLLTKPQKERIVFIVSVKPEALLVEDESKEQSIIKDLDKHIYDKLFDYTINLKPLHCEDYESVIFDIIYNDMDNKSNLEYLLGYAINNKLSDEFRWIMQGQNLTIRNLKNRLNQAIALMVTLKNKNYKLQSKSAISFATCAAVTYLEETYESQYYEVIKHENKLAQIIRSSYDIRNSGDDNEEKQTKLVNMLGYFSSFAVTDAFIKDMAQLILSGTIDEDFKMYFYNYPKGSHIKTSDEKDLCDLLLLPEEHPKDELLNEKVSRLLMINKDKNIITECLERISAKLETAFPSIILDNEYLFSYAMKINITKTKNTVIRNATWTNQSFKQSEMTIRKICKFSNEVRHRFFNVYCPSLEKRFLSFENPQIIRVRSSLIDILGEEIILFKKLFYPIDENLISDGDNNDIPLITNEELQNITDTSTCISLINREKISDENVDYISQRINTNVLSKDELELAEEFYLAIFESVESETIAPLLLDFLSINNYVNIKLFNNIVDWVNDVLYDDQPLAIKFYKYINSLEEIPNEYLVEIDNMCISNGLNDDVLLKLKDNKLLSTFLCSMFKANRLKEIDFSNDVIVPLVCNACAYINNIYNYDELFIAIRLTILQTAIESSFKYMVLFSDEYPLITKDELLCFTDISSALPFICISIINQENYKNLIDFLNATERTGPDCYKFFEFMFQENALEDVTISMEIIQQIDYSVVKYNEMSEEQKNNVAASISDIMQFSEPNNCLDYMILTKSLTTSLEEKTSEDMEDDYIALINDLNQCTSYTIQWLSNQLVTYALNNKLTDALLEKGEYESYIIGKTLFDEKLTFDTESIPFEHYLSAYINDNEVFEFMKNNDDFLQAVVSNGVYEDLEPDRIMPLTKFRQPIKLILQAFKTMTSDQIETYLYSFKHLNEERDSGEFLKYIKTDENYKKLSTYNARRRARELIWSPSDRQSFTKFMHKFFPYENYRNNVDFDLLD